MAYRAVTVDTTTREIIPYRADRTSLVMLNNGTDDIYISNDPQNVATNGFRVGPGVVVSLTVADGDEPELAIWAVASSGSQDVRIIEQYGRVPRGE